MNNMEVQQYDDDEIYDQMIEEMLEQGFNAGLNVTTYASSQTPNWILSTIQALTSNYGSSKL